METITITKRVFPNGKTICNKKFDDYEKSAFYGKRISLKEYEESKANCEVLSRWRPIKDLNIVEQITYRN